MTVVVGPLTPSYLSIDATTGTVAGQFTGGVQLTEAPNGQYAPQSWLEWLGTDGTAKEEIYGLSPDGNIEHFLTLFAGVSGGPYPTAELDLKSGLNKNTPGDTAEASIVVGNVIYNFDSFGGSSFLQLQSYGQLALAVGAGSATFTASTVSAAVNLAHNIGRKAKYVGLIITGNEYGGINPVWLNQNDTVNDAQIVLISQSSISLIVNFAWVAIG